MKSHLFFTLSPCSLVLATASSGCLSLSPGSLILLLLRFLLIIIIIVVHYASEVFSFFLSAQWKGFPTQQASERFLKLVVCHKIRERDCSQDLAKPCGVVSLVLQRC